MISWIWIPIALMGGIMIGVVVTVVLALNNVPDDKKRWWENDE